MTLIRLFIRYLPELLITIGLAVGGRWLWIFLIAAVVVFLIIKSRG